MATKKKIREELRRLVDELTDRDLLPAQRYLQYLKHSADPFVGKLLDAPEDDEPETEEERAAVEEAKVERTHGAGRSWEEVRKELAGG